MSPSSLFTTHSQNSIHLSGSSSLRCCNSCILYGCHLWFFTMHMILNLLTALSAANLCVLFWGTPCKCYQHHLSCTSIIWCTWTTTSQLVCNTFSLLELLSKFGSSVVCDFLPCFLLKSIAALWQLPGRAIRMISIHSSFIENVNFPYVWRLLDDSVEGSVWRKVALEVSPRMYCLTWNTFMTFLVVVSNSNHAVSSFIVSFLIRHFCVKKTG